VCLVALRSPRTRGANGSIGSSRIYLTFVQVTSGSARVWWRRDLPELEVQMAQLAHLEFIKHLFRSRVVGCLSGGVEISQNETQLS
jgi:hypothetical protein